MGGGVKRKKTAPLRDGMSEVTRGLFLTPRVLSAMWSSTESRNHARRDRLSAPPHRDLCHPAPTHSSRLFRVDALFIIYSITDVLCRITGVVNSPECSGCCVGFIYADYLQLINHIDQPVVW